MDWTSPRRLEVTIPQEYDGMRLSSLVKYKLGVSGTVLRRIKWVEDGILLDGVRAFADRRVEAGQRLSLLLSDPNPSYEFPAAEGPLDILYEDRDIIVINKPAGVTVHPGPGHHEDTIGNYLLWHFMQNGEPAGVHPVHRLDRGTSGVLITAKHPYAQDRLRILFHSEEFVRTYIALCRGHVPESLRKIDAPLGRSEDSILKRAVCADGLPAVTHVRVLGYSGENTLVCLRLETGRTHQIRVHMAYAGYPLVGDFLYGDEDHSVIDRPALHSYRVRVRHPVTGELLELTAPVPQDILRLCTENQRALLSSSASMD